ncbi:uncharacterized protein LOC113795079 [Dermatophagoides pteronyssinus]|uniref:uncharacterized protein LOC113795079 n=1 Tax=Dermatophagoides pteronyssinus TaxID=6956 RepID=UPI003F6790EC
MSDKHIETVNHLKKKLDKGVSFEKTMHILHKLQKIPISFQLLEETGIGYKLRELSKQEKNNDIGKTAKLLINAWKQFLKNQQKRQEEEEDDDDDESEHESMNNDDHHHSYDQEYQSGNMDSDDQQQQHFNGNNDDDNDDDDDERNHYVSDNRSEESTSPNHHETINTNSNKKKHKKKKKSKSKENNLKDDDGDERKERKKDKKRKHRNDDSVGSSGGGNVIDTNNKRYRSSCDNDYSQKYLNGEMMMTTPNESRCPNTKDQTSSSSRHSKTIISSSNGDDMFSSMLNMSDQVLTATATTTTTSAKHHGRNNNRMDQSSLNNDDYSSYSPYQPQQSSSSSSFDREMMQSLNASANRYDPSIYQYYQPQKSNINNDDLDKDKNSMINMAGMKFKGRTQVYAGSSKVVTVPKVYRLQDICIKVLMNHVNKIYEVGDLPYFILKPVFAKCTVQQLRRIEHYNPQLLEDTDELWREFCEKDFKNKRMDQNKFEFWRDFYDHCLNEREQKLKNITKNINSKQRQAIPERKTQQLDAAKTPREIRRRQERNFNTPYPLSKSSTSSRAIGGVGGGGIKAALSSSITQISNKSKPAPLMKKLLQMRHSKFRR